MAAGKSVSKQTIEKMKECRDNGKSVKYIMASFHLSESTVIRHTKKKSWKLNIHKHLFTN